MFGYHPANLAFRFLLEVTALVTLGVGVFAVAPIGFRWPVAILGPVIASTVWGTFNVPGDGSRSGRAPVAVSGPFRLVLEVIVLGTAVVVCFAVSVPLAIALGGATTVHYALSIDRIRWLLAEGAREETRADVE
jgi:hypothetical protein